MKKRIMALLALAALSCALLAGCAGGKDGGTEAFSADLTEFYATLFQGEDAPMMMALPDDMVENIYPGLGDVACRQSVLYMAAISAVAAEVAMVEVADPDDVQTVQDIFRSRIDSMVEGGAMYPATAEVWQNNAQIVTRGSYVCLFVSGDSAAMADAFNALGQN